VKAYICNGQARIQSLGAGLCTVHDGMTSIKTHLVFKSALSSALSLVPRVCQPPIRLEKDSRAEVIRRIPPGKTLVSHYYPMKLPRTDENKNKPVRWTRGRATSAKNTFVQSIKLFSLLYGLAILPSVGRRRLALKIWLDRLVLLVELGKIRNQILHDVGMRKRVYLDGRRVGDINTTYSPQTR